MLLCIEMCVSADDSERMKQKISVLCKSERKIMINMLIGSALTLWVLSGLFGYLVNSSTFSKKLIDLKMVKWSIKLQTEGSPHIRFSRRVENIIIELLHVSMMIVMGPIAIFVAMMNRDQAGDFDSWRK